MKIALFKLLSQFWFLVFLSNYVQAKPVEYVFSFDIPSHHHFMSEGVVSGSFLYDSSISASAKNISAWGDEFGDFNQYKKAVTNFVIRFKGKEYTSPEVLINIVDAPFDSSKKDGFFLDSGAHEGGGKAFKGFKVGEWVLTGFNLQSEFRAHKFSSKKLPRELEEGGLHFGMILHFQKKNEKTILRSNFGKINIKGQDNRINDCQPRKYQVSSDSLSKEKNIAILKYEYKKYAKLVNLNNDKKNSDSDLPIKILHKAKKVFDLGLNSFDLGGQNMESSFINYVNACVDVGEYENASAMIVEWFILLSKNYGKNSNKLNKPLLMLSGINKGRYGRFRRGSNFKALEKKEYLDLPHNLFILYFSGVAGQQLPAYRLRDLMDQSLSAAYDAFIQSNQYSEAGWASLYLAINDSYSGNKIDFFNFYKEAVRLAHLAGDENLKRLAGKSLISFLSEYYRHQKQSEGHKDLPALYDDFIQSGLYSEAAWTALFLTFNYSSNGNNIEFLNFYKEAIMLGQLGGGEDLKRNPGKILSLFLSEYYRYHKKSEGHKALLALYDAFFQSELYSEAAWSALYLAFNYSDNGNKIEFLKFYKEAFRLGSLGGDENIKRKAAESLNLSLNAYYGHSKKLEAFQEVFALCDESEDYKLNSNYEMIETSEPRYPGKANRHGRAGYAVVEFEVSSQGDIENPRVVEEWPEAYGFGRSALKAVLKSKARPALINCVMKRGPYFNQYTFAGWPPGQYREWGSNHIRGPNYKGSGSELRKSDEYKNVRSNLLKRSNGN